MSNVSRPCTCHQDDEPPTPCEHRYAFRDCADAAEERYLSETLAMLQESYAKAAKPYMDRLVALRSRRLPQMLVTLEQAQALGLMPANAKVSGAGTAIKTPPLAFVLDRTLPDTSITSKIPHNALEDARALRAYAMNVHSGEGE